MGDSGSEGNWTYGDYLQLSALLELQGEDRAVSPDEMHFIIVHQTFELWFKQVIRELTEVRDILAQNHVPEDDIPRAVDHLGRTTEIFRIMANQWTVLETYQMREFEILLGLANEDRLYGMDPISTFRELAKNSERDAAILTRLEDVASKPSLCESLLQWVSRTPIMGSLVGNDGDEHTVTEYIDEHLSSHENIGKQAAERMSGYGASNSEKAAERFAASHQGAIDFLKPDGKISRARAGLLFIESNRELPLLTWPRTLIDAIVELEESMVKWRHSHARMVERIMGRRIGTGGTSGVDYLDATSQYRIFKDLWAVRTILVKPDFRPELKNAEFYGYSSEN